MRLRAGRIALMAAMLSAVGLLVSTPTMSLLSWVWFAVLMGCLGLSVLRLRRSGERGDGASVPAPAPPIVNVPVAAVSAAQERDLASSFLSSVGHDLRQPLQAISLYAATLATHPLSDASKQLVGGLEAAAETLSVQFEEVMAIAKLESERTVLDPKPVSLEAILSSSVAIHLDDAHDKSLHLRYVATSARVWADEAQLARAVDRLVAHAIRTTERGGVLVGCRRRGENVLLEVCDTSGGIAPAMLVEAFKPFSQYGQRLLDRALGLVLAERIVQRLGGALSLKSVAGRGVIYSLQLPRLNAVQGGSVDSYVDS